MKKKNNPGCPCCEIGGCTPCREFCFEFSGVPDTWIWQKRDSALHSACDTKEISGFAQYNDTIFCVDLDAISPSHSVEYFNGATFIDWLDYYVISSIRLTNAPILDLYNNYVCVFANVVLGTLRQAQCSAHAWVTPSVPLVSSYASECQSNVFLNATHGHGLWGGDNNPVFNRCTQHSRQNASFLFSLFENNCPVLGDYYYTITYNP